MNSREDPLDEVLQREGDLTMGSEGDPGPTGSATSTHERAPRSRLPRGRPQHELNEDARERRPGLGGGGKDRIDSIEDVTEGGTSAGGTSEKANSE